MRIYLDNCCLQRPLDNQTHPRVRVETEALFAVLAAVQSKDIVLCSSEALRYEIDCTPDEVRRSEGFSMLSLATEYLTITDAVEMLASSFEQQGLKPMDAVHLALASLAGVDYFCTSDDKFFRKAQYIPDLGCKVSTLLNLVMEITNE